MTALAAAAAAVAAWLILRPRPHGARRSRYARRHIRVDRVTSMRLVSLSLGFVVAVVLGGIAGAAVGIVVALLAPRLLTRLESRDERGRRDALERQAPTASDLIAACLAAGATPTDAARAVGEALGPPIRDPLRRMVSALDLGADPIGAWSMLAADEPLRPIARAAARSAETGAPLAMLLTAVADDQRDEARSRAEAMARASGVRSVAPLAACFLPAFLLIGIVPVVASLALPLMQ